MVSRRAVTSAPSSVAASTLAVRPRRPGRPDRRPVVAASLDFRRASSFSRARTFSKTWAILPGTSPTGALKAATATSSIACCCWTRASALSPVTASTRRTPAATPASAVILNRPISPVRVTCVPPHSSTRGAQCRARARRRRTSRRTASWRPGLLGFGDGQHAVTQVAALGSTSALTRFSTLRISSSVIGCVVAEVEAGLVRIDLRALLLHVVAEYFAQRLVQQVGRRVVAQVRWRGRHVDLGVQLVADGQAYRS